MFSFFSSFLISCLFRSQLSVCVCVFSFHATVTYRDLELDIRPDCTFSSLFSFPPPSHTYTLFFLIIYDTYEKLFGIIELHIDKLAAHV